MYLSDALGPRDIQLSALWETLQAGYRIPRGMWDSARVPPFTKLAVQLLGGKSVLHRHMISKLKNIYRAELGQKPQHASAVLVKQSFPSEWAEFTKFCVVRNPYSLAVSDYKWRTRRLARKPSFSEYLEALEKGDSLGGIVPVGFYNNWRQYTIDDKIVVDHVIRYENLSADLGGVLSTLGISIAREFPNLKNLDGAKEASRPNYREYYDSKSVEIVSSLYEQEISTFGYTF